MDNGASVGSTIYTYTAIGNLKTVALTAGITHSFGYNNKQFLVTEKHPEMDVIPGDPDSACIRYTLYNNGKIHTKKDARGTISYTYDTIDRLTTIDYDNNNTPDVTYTYYKNDCINTVTSLPVTYTYTYYDDKKLKGKTYSIDSHSYTMSFTYNNLRNLLSITYPKPPNESARIVTYNYYSDNQYIQSVKDSKLGRNLAYSIKYYPTGQISQITYGNTKTTKFGYDDKWRITSIDAGSIFNQSYTYDGCSNITSIVDSRFNVYMNDGYPGYDNLNRLIHAKGPWGRVRYGYDYSGNRKSMTFDSGSINYNINPTTNRLDAYTATFPSQTITYNYFYDESGNMQEREMVAGNEYTYDFDQANRLKYVELLTSEGGTKPQYTNIFDGAGNRIKLIDHDEGVDKTVVYHYGLGNEVLSETKPDGIPIVDYIYLGNKILSKYTWPNP